MESVRAGDRRQVASMLDADPDLVRAYDDDCFGATALINAVNRRDRLMIDLLLERGADLDQRSDWWAGSFGVLPCDDAELGAYLIERGATVDVHAAAGMDMRDELRRLLDDDPALVHARGGDGQMPLHFAASEAVVDLLLERGADIDARDIDHGSTAAQWLVKTRPHVCRSLVQRGAEADPFMLCGVGDVGRLRAMLDDDASLVHARIDDERFGVAPPAAGHIYMFTIGRHATLLHLAAQANQAEVARLLVERGADVNATGGYDDATPLHCVAWDNAVDVARVLIDAGADVNRTSGAIHHNEPVGWAIVSGAAEMVGLLLESGAMVRDMHREDARAGRNGEFRQWTCAEPARFEAIIERLGDA